MNSYPVCAKLSLLTTLIGLFLSSAVYAQGNGNNGQPFQELQNQIDFLTQRLDALESGSPVALDVDCNTEETVGAALDSVPSITPVEITITGRCSEPLLITRDDVLIRGATQADGFTGNGPRFINGPSRAIVENLTIDASSAVFGVGCFQGSAVVVRNVEIIGGVFGVFAVAGGQCLIVNSLIDGARTGALSLMGSLVDLQGNTTIINSATEGVRVTQGGNARLQILSSISNNNIGVRSSGGSHVSVHGSIADNIQDGLIVAWGATAQVDAASIRDNGGNGITVTDNSTLIVFSGQDISGNTGWGIQCTVDSTLVGTPSIGANDLGTIDCP